MPITEIKRRKQDSTYQLVDINGYPTLNTTDLILREQWTPPSGYLLRVLEAWEKAVRDLYRMCRTETPEGIRFGFIYDETAESGRVGDVFLVAPFVVSVPGTHGTRAFKKRFSNFIRTEKEPGLRERFHKLALVEVGKTITETIDSW